MSKYRINQGVGGLPLFGQPSSVDGRDAPPPPSGPLGTASTKADAKWERFEAFRYSEQGVEFWQWLSNKALAALEAGDTRFSVRTWTAFYRDHYGVGITNDFTPWLADELVARHPQLLTIIQRKLRRKQR